MLLMESLLVKVLVKQISLICFRAYLEVYVAKNPTCFSRWSIRGEEMMIIANKRLCNMADATTQDIVGKMCAEIVKHDKDNIWSEFLVPMCKYTGECKEIYPCKKAIKKVVVTEPND